MSFSLFGVVGVSQIYAAGSPVKVVVTEQIPGAKCDPISEAGTGPEKKKFTCTVE